MVGIKIVDNVIGADCYKLERVVMVIFAYTPTDISLRLFINTLPLYETVLFVYHRHIYGLNEEAEQLGRGP
jgi:hypothetical protein